VGLLHRVPADIVPLKDWVAAHPDTQVYVDPTINSPRRSNAVIAGLSQYESIVSGTRDSSREADTDNRLPDREIVVGISIRGDAKAYQESVVLDVSLINDRLEDTPIVVVVDSVSQAIKFFIRETDGQILTFNHNGNALVDQETGSVWNFEGLAISGSLEGTQLEEIPGLPSYWFAWVTFHPETALFSN
jgi:hypothetical protein